VGLATERVEEPVVVHVSGVHGLFLATVGTDPDDLSFTRSYRAIRRQVSNQAGFSP
jgi:hypothetical protein